MCPAVVVCRTQSYPVKFYGHVSVHQEEGRQVFRWNAGEQVMRGRVQGRIAGPGWLAGAP